MIGYVLEGEQVFNVLYIAESVTPEIGITVGVYHLGGNDIGAFTVKNDDVTSRTTATTSGDSYANAQRSWWGCTKDCIGDAHIACYGDGHCTAMLIATNIAGGVIMRPRIGGVGSLSISVACGAVCAYNSNIDLLPQY